MGTTNSSNDKTDIIVVGWNHVEQTERCIDSIVLNATDEATFNLIYVDNGSKEKPALGWFETSVLLSENTGYCHGNNVGLALSLLSDSKYVLLLNNDAWIPDGDSTWLERMIQVMEKDRTFGAVGAVSDNVFGWQRRGYGQEGFMVTPVLIGFCLLLRKEAIQQVGLLDERFDPDGNYSDFDYSIRLQRAGWKLAIAESVFIHHEMSVTQRDLDFASNLVKNKGKLFEKWDREALKLVGL